MCFLRRMIQISWAAKKSNETVLEEADTKKSLTHKICQATLIGPYYKKEKSEHLVTTTVK